jgi:transcriptional regulator
MYKLKYFTETDTEKVIAFMKQYSFAVITGHGEYPVATHIPLEIIQQDDKMFFTGHIMKNSDHHRSFSQNDKVLVVFNGPHCHISASWYSDPNVASTWNYMAVHAKGKISFGDEAFTRKLVEDLTNKYESPESISAFNKLPVEYIDRLLKSIVGFTIEVESFENVFKLSQNHDEATRKSIIEHLLKAGAPEEIKIAEEMQQRVHLPKQYK